VSTATGAPWVVVGCGYAGERVAGRLAGAGARVVVTTRREERAAELTARLPGVEVRVVDALEPDELKTVIPAGSVLVYSVPPDPERDPPTMMVRTVLAAADARARRIVYLSSTGVYGRGAGEWVDEDTPPRPESVLGVARFKSETALMSSAGSMRLEQVALRVAAIYGPGRGVHARLARGEYRLVGDGANWVSRIHVDDLAGVIVAAGTVAPLLRASYAVADDAPTAARAHAEGVAALLGLPPPPSVPADALPPEVAELTLGNRRVRNTRMKAELGVTLAYPSWREGVAALLAAGTGG
jgi:nucleoside-diphosphate-sugar epimerase